MSNFHDPVFHCLHEIIFFYTSTLQFQTTRAHQKTNAKDAENKDRKNPSLICKWKL